MYQASSNLRFLHGLARTPLVGEIDLALASRGSE